MMGKKRFARRSICGFAFLLISALTFARGVSAQSSPVSPKLSAPYSGLVWKFIGPENAPQTGNGIISGEVTAIAVDTTDGSGNTLFAASADGGVWKTTNGGATWTPLTDNLPTLAIGALAIAPSDHTVIYAGTGVQQWIGVDVYAGIGVLRSIDGGATWTQTCSSSGTSANTTCPFVGPFSSGSVPGNGARISALAVNPANANQILAAAQIYTGTDSQPGEPGIYCSDDQGATWMLLNLHPAIAGGASGTSVFYASGTVAYAALGRITGDSQNGIYVSTNANSPCVSQQWAPVGGAGLPAQSSVGHIVMSFAPNVASNPSNADGTKIILYAEIASASTSSQNSLGIFRSADGGSTWVKTSFPDNCTPTCASAMALAADPDDSSGNTLFAGGSGSPALLRSVDGGNTFSAIDSSASSTITAGYHALVFAPGPTSSRMIAGTDGGIWSTANAAAQSVSWNDLNAFLPLAAFNAGYAIDLSAPSNSVGGTQRNGMIAYAGSSTVAWTALSVCADGGAAIVDLFVPSTIYFSCANTSAPELWRTFAGLSTTSAFTEIGTAISSSDPIDSVPPFIQDPSTPGRLYFATNRVWQSNDYGDTWSAVSGNLASTIADGVALGALAVDSSNPTVVYTGAEDGTVQISKNITAGGMALFSNISSGLPAREITHIAVDPSDVTGNTAYVAFSGYSTDVSIFGIATDLQGHVFRTSSAGASWADIGCHVSDCAQPGATDLPNAPVRDLAIDTDDPSHLTIYAATDSGVYATTDGGADWTLLAAGMPNAAVVSLALHEPSRTLRAATHGRGAWELELPALAGTPAFELSGLSQSSVAAGNSSVPLTLTGRGFTGASSVLSNGSPSGVTVVGTPSSTSIDVTLASTLVSEPGTISIRVSDASQSPTTTDALNFTVTGSAPAIHSIAPNSAVAEGATGTSDLAIVISGSGFAANAQVTVEGSTAGIATTLVNAAGTQIDATLSHTYLQYGGTLYVGVANPAAGGGASLAPIAFTVTNSSAPVNDNFANAIAVSTATFSSTVDNSAATNESTDPVPTCANASQIPSKTVWWVYTPGSAGNVTVSTAGSSYDTLLAAYTGTPGNLLQVTCDDDVTPGLNRTSQVRITAVAATTYFFLVGVANPAAALANPDFESGGKTVFNLSGPAPAGVSALPISLTITAGATASYNVTSLTPPFAGQVALTISGCPTNATCTFSANTVSAGSGTMLNVVTAATSTVPSSSRRIPARTDSFDAWKPFYQCVFAAFVFAALQLWRSRKSLPKLRFAILCAAFAIGCAGCDGFLATDATPPPTTNTGTPSGIYTITVTATANTITATTSVTLNVN